MIIEAIFRGNFSLDRFSCPDDPEYKELNKAVGDISTEIKDKLQNEDEKLVDKLLSQVYSAQLLEAESCFKAGLAAGMELQKELSKELLILQE